MFFYFFIEPSILIFKLWLWIKRRTPSVLWEASKKPKINSTLKNVPLQYLSRMFVWTINFKQCGRVGCCVKGTQLLSYFQIVNPSHFQCHNLILVHIFSLQLILLYHALGLEWLVQAEVKNNHHNWIIVTTNHS